MHNVQASSKRFRIKWPSMHRGRETKTRKPVHFVSHSSRSSHAEEAWSASAWVASLGICDTIARKLLSRLPEGSSELDFINGFDVDDARSRKRLRKLLRADGDLIKQLADDLYAGLLAFSKQEAATGLELHEKFVSVPANQELKYGSLNTFFEGLDGVVGPPMPNLYQAMAAEHCDAHDSDEKFTTNNYGITTTSRIEWSFVVEGAEGLGQLECQHDGYPAEAEDKLPKESPCRRKAQRLAAFDSKLKEVNDQLTAISAPALKKVELIGGRLYTGPLYREHAQSSNMRQ